MIRDSRLVRGIVTFARNSPWLMIALGLHVILATGMSVLYVRHERQRTNAAATGIAVAQSRPVTPEVLPVEVKIDLFKIPEQEDVELVTPDEAAAFLPTEEPQEIDLHALRGDPTGTDDEFSSTGGGSIGVGSGSNWGNGTPAPFRGRHKAGTNRYPKGSSRGGPVQATEEAVLEGLRWLIRHQNDDGSWSARELHAHCTTDPACIAADESLDNSYDVGMTGLALLAFLGQGIAPGARFEIVDTAMGKEHQAGAVVKRGIKWLMEQQNADGSFSPARPFELPENDTLPTMALCEAYGLAPSNRLIRQQAQKALDFLVAAQKRGQGGTPWGFGPGSQADLDQRHARGELADELHAEACRSVDLSVTCWVVMALQSARTCGFEVPDASFAGALAYGVDATGEGALEADAPVDKSDKFTYHPARKSALGMLIRTFAGGEITDAFLENAAREIAADVPKVGKDQLAVDFYYWYFATLALNQFDGPDSPRSGSGRYWEPWNEGLVDALPPLQDRVRKNDVCSRGGWLQEARGNRRGRALYNTALNILTLEVYYRFDNVFGAATRK